jgi:hypothetical protein
LTYDEWMTYGACTYVESTSRSVMRTTWAPFTFHFKAKMHVRQGGNTWLWMPDGGYGQGGWNIFFYKNTYGRGMPTVDSTGRIANKEYFAAFSWFGGNNSKNPVEIEWEYSFADGETFFNYGVEVKDDWHKLIYQHGFYGGIMFGGPTRSFNLVFEDVETWITWGGPRADPLNGISRLPGIFAPLSMFPTKVVNGVEIIDSGSTAVAVKDLPRWGWFTETVLVNREGYFLSSGGYIRGSFSVWFGGDHLEPDRDWESVGPVGGMGNKLWRFRLTSTYRSTHLVGMVSLTYMVDTPASNPSWRRPSRRTITNVMADQEEMINVRGLL